MKRSGLVMAAALVAGGFALVGALGGASAQTPTSPDEIIATRQAGFKHVGDLFNAMKKGIDGGLDVAQFASGAKEISDFGKKIPTLFPPGTETGHDTHAQPAIWTDRATFDQNAGNMSTEAGKLAEVAASGDKAAFAAQWQKTGGTCGSCHANQKFRTRI
jgi:cytochrome c556